jgi:hypothetical protein
MKTPLFILIAFMLLGLSSASAQSNKIVFGPLEGDDAGVLTVRNGEAIGIELWVRTDPDNPENVVGAAHALMSEDVIIEERNGMDFEPEYDAPPWIYVFVDGPFVHDPSDSYPIPEGWTCEMQGAWGCRDFPPHDCQVIDTQGEWDLYGTWLMVTNTEIPTEQTYYPLMQGWYPHSGQTTHWAFEGGGGTVPEQSFCGLYVEPDTCIYIPGDVNRNGAPLELTDVLAMIGFYRGTMEPYLCECTEDPPIYDFAATADPNGNCVPNELNDVVTEIGAYRGSMTASGCPDCPGTEGLLRK